MNAADRAKVCTTPTAPSSSTTAAAQVQSKSASGRTMRVRNRQKTINTVSGIRTLATIWIVLGHFQDTAFRDYKDTTFLLVLNRGYIPVGMYIILSGFITHYAYKRKSYKTWNSLWSFYIKRMGRVFFTYFASCILGLVDPLFTRHDALATKYPEQAIATCLLIQSWFEFPSNIEWSRDIPSQPNPAGWTISTLIFAWMLYPALNKMMKVFNKLSNNSLRFKMVLLTLLYAGVMAPCLILFLSQDGKISNQQFEFLYKFPPVRIFDFWIGMVFAEMVDDPKVTKTFLCSVVPDILSAAFIVFVAIGQLVYQDLSTIPDNVEQPLVREDAETFLISGLSPVMGAILLGYSINSGNSRVKYSLTSALEHPIMTELGGFSFAVYCFQYTLFFMFEQWQFNNTHIESIFVVPETGQVIQVPAKLIAAYFMPYLFALVTLSAFWTVWFERPFASILAGWVRRTFETKHPRKQHQSFRSAKPSFSSKDAAHSVGGSTSATSKTSMQDLEMGKARNSIDGSIYGQGVANISLVEALQIDREQLNAVSFDAPSRSSRWSRSSDVPSLPSGGVSSRQDFDGYDTDDRDDDIENFSYGGEDEASSSEDDDREYQTARNMEYFNCTTSA